MNQDITKCTLCYMVDAPGWNSGMRIIDDFSMTDWNMDFDIWDVGMNTFFGRITLPQE